MTQDQAIQRVKDSNGKDSHLLPRVIEGDLDLEDCTSLVSLPEGLTVHGHLVLDYCTSLVSLPKGLTVNWSLYLTDCTSLVSLSEGLTVGNDLYIGGRTPLRSLSNATAKTICLSPNHKIPDTEIAMARFSDIKVIVG